MVQKGYIANSSCRTFNLESVLEADGQAMEWSYNTALGSFIIKEAGTFLCFDKVSFGKAGKLGEN